MSKIYKVSESVCAGHPDKIADQISDAILDVALAQDKTARVAVETLVAKNTVVLAGETRTTATFDYETIVRNIIARNGYDRPEWGFDTNVQIINKIHEQSAEIAIGVDAGGAGDQGLMYGYATNETDTYLPLPIALSHALCKAIDDTRTSKKLEYLRPDGKSQVVVAYEDGTATDIEHITIAVPHDESVELPQVTKDIIHHIITPVLTKFGFSVPKNIIINGTGVWHMPGPASDVGLTGRKIVVDTYGGAARVGGGAFSGKDPSKVDRSGAYAARYIAKNIVANGYAAKAEVCLAYYIGAKHPIIETINTFGTETINSNDLEVKAHALLDCSVKGILETLQLRRPIYLGTATYGHFGKKNLPWENIVSMV